MQGEIATLGPGRGLCAQIFNSDKRLVSPKKGYSEASSLRSGGIEARVKQCADMNKGKLFSGMEYRVRE